MRKTTLKVKWFSRTIRQAYEVTSIVLFHAAAVEQVKQFLVQLAENT